ncbi:MAG: SGNH/GDSL hydrolase family protein [Bacteroidota bacterium]
MRIFIFLLGILLLACQSTESQSQNAAQLPAESSSTLAANKSAVPKIIVFGGNVLIENPAIEARLQDVLPNSLAANGFEREIIDWGRKDLLLGVPDERLAPMLDSIIKQQPEWVILGFGTDEVWREDIAVQSFAVDMQGMILALQKADIKTLVLTPNNPSPNAPKVIWARGEEISRVIREVAIENFSTVADYWNFCEIYVTQAGNQPQDLLLDERYPNEAAHQFISQEITALLAFKIGTE